MDKATQLGLDGLWAEVTARWSDEGFWYPWEARLGGPESGRAELERLIEAELGIPAERQSWEAE